MAGVAEDVELPIRVHDLLLGMAGRVDDDALTAARERLAVGDPTGAVEMLTGCLIAGKVVTTPAEQDNLSDLLRQVHSDPGLAAGLRVRETWRIQEHRFSTEDGPDHGVGSALRPVLETLPGIESISCVWRTTPSGAAPCALPQRVVLVELGPEGLPTATSFRVHYALRAAGLPSVVEVLRPGTARPDYHVRALAEAHGVDGHRGGFRDEAPHAQSRPGTPSHGRRVSGRVPAEPRLAAEPRESDYAEPRGIDSHGYEPDRIPDDRPLARPKPVVKRASVTRIQSPRTPSGSVQTAPSGSRPGGSSGGPVEDSGDQSSGSSALAAPTGNSSRTDSAGKVQPATADHQPAPVSLKPSATPTETHATEEPAVEPPHTESRPAAVEPRPVESRSPESRSVEPRLVEPRSAEPRLVEPRSAEPRQGESRQGESRSNRSVEVAADEPTPVEEPVAARSLAAVPDEPAAVEDSTPDPASAPAPVRSAATMAASNPAASSESADSAADHPAADRSHADRSHADRSHADPAHAERPGNERPVTERSVADRAVADRPAADRPAADRSHAERPHAERPHAERLVAERSSGQRATSAAPKQVRTGRDKPSRLLPGENPRSSTRATNGSSPDAHEPGSGYFANPELAGIGPAEPAAEARADHHVERAAEPGAEPTTGTQRAAQPAASAESAPPKRRIPEMPASVAKNLNDKERDLLRQLHEELAQREQQEQRQDSKKWQLARPTPKREQASSPASNGNWSPVAATEETLVNGIPPIKP